MKSKRAKSTDITTKTKQVVFKRDGGVCIICHQVGKPNAHYISRAKGGLGIEQNVVTLCQICHHEYDNGKGTREQYKEMIKDYLGSIYDNWNEEELVYRKWTF